MFLAWFEANKRFEEGMNLTYAEFPTKFVSSLNKGNGNQESRVIVLVD